MFHFSCCCLSPKRRAGPVLIWALFFCFQAALPLGAQLADHFPLRSFEVEALDRFFLELGKTPPFYSRPFSNHRFYYYLRSLEQEAHRLSTHNRLVYDRLLSKLERQRERFIYFAPVLEGNLRFQLLSEEVSEFDRYLYYRRSLQNTPLLNLGFAGGLPYFVAHSELDLRRDFFSTYRPSNYTNLPISGAPHQELDFNFPTRGYLSLGNLYLSLLVGRDELKWGPGYRSSLVLSDSPPYYDMLCLECFLKIFKASFFFATLESYLTGAEKKVQEENKDSGSLNYPKDNLDQYKALTGHRFELDLFDRVLIGMNDIIVIGGRVPEFNEITPLMFLHNIYGENYSNVILGFDVVIVPLKRLALYGEIAIDDIRNPKEDEGSPPTSLGLLSGFHYTRGFEGGTLDVRFEWAWIGPWTYNRWMPYLIFSSRKKYLSLATDENTYLDFPTGYFLGPDVQSFYLEVSYAWLDLWNVRLSYELRQKGRIYLDVLDPESEYENYRRNPSSTPTGTPAISHILSLGAAYSPTPCFSLSGDLALGYRINRAHRRCDNGLFFEAGLNATVKLDRERYAYYLDRDESRFPSD